MNDGTLMNCRHLLDTSPLKLKKSRILRIEKYLSKIGEYWRERGNINTEHKQEYNKKINELERKMKKEIGIKGIEFARDNGREILGIGQNYKGRKYVLLYGNEINGYLNPKRPLNWFKRIFYSRFLSKSS